MAHTNSTQYYNLPQFIGTDVPGWLTDVNQGYAAIDAGMRAAQVKADQADQTAGQAANDVQALGTTVTTQASQIAAAAQSASSAQSAANAADAKADTNAANIAGLDGRVTALEQGSGLTVSEVTITTAISTATGSGQYISNEIDISAGIPDGKTIDDVVNIFLKQSSNIAWVGKSVNNGVILASTANRTSNSYTLALLLI